MQGNVNLVFLVSLCCGLFGLETSANGQRYVVPMEKVLPEDTQEQQQPPADEYRMEHDKSAVELKMLQPEPEQQHPHPHRHQHQHQQLRHGQHHLRHLDKYQLAWEQPEDYATQFGHQHKSQLQPKRAPANAAVDDTDYPASGERAMLPASTDKPLATAGQSESGVVATKSQWMQRQRKHRWQKQQREKEVQALKLERNARLTHVTTQTNHVSAAEKSLEDTNGHNADNSYSSNHIAGTLTAHKEKMLGTPEAVLMTRRQKEEAREKAYAHMEEVRNENGCHLPQKRWIRIERDPSKIYTPHCTSIYRCAEDSGCCPGLSEICAPKRTERIEKDFHVKVKNKRVFTETLTFVNHTECHCIERSNYYAEGVIANSVAGVQRATILSCNCPRHFERILQNDGQCRCDCSSSNIDCEFLKRGSEHFSMNDRKCIQQGRCKPPTCQFGEYLKKHGRCPRHQEQLPHQQVSYNSLGMS